MTTTQRLVWRILVATLKGGVGKTTTTMLLALYFALRDLTVLVICADAKHRSATKWTNRILMDGQEPPYIFVQWSETDGPLGMFAREQEKLHSADIVLIDGGNEKETFTQGCMYAEWLISPVMPNPGELDGIPDTYKFAESVKAAGSPLEMWVLLTRSPQRGKGVAAKHRTELESAPDDIDPETPWTLGLNVLKAEISRSLSYSDMYGTVPPDVSEYKELAIELMKLRAAHTKEAVAS